jgi:hypothetical protein
MNEEQRKEILERQTRLINDIQGRVNYYVQEYHFTYAEIIGLLEAVKMNMANDWLSGSTWDDDHE